MKGFVFASILLFTAAICLNGCAAMNAKSLRAEARVDEQAGQNDTAAVKYRESLRNDSESPASLLANSGLSRLYLKNDDCEHALPHLQKAQGIETKAEEIGPEMSAPVNEAIPVYQGLGYCQAKAGDLLNASTNYMEAYALNPQDPAPLLAIGEFLDKIQPTADSHALFETLVTRFPDQYYGYAFQGDLYWREGDMNQAKPYFVKSLQLFPHSVPVRIKLGSILMAQGQYPEAKEQFAAALALKDGPATRFNMAGVEFMIGNLDEAIKHLNAMLKVEPGHPQANALLAQCYFMQKKYSKALDHSEAALAKLGLDNYALLALAGEAAYREKFWVKAAKWLGEACKKPDATAANFGMLGAAQTHLNLDNEAQNSFATAIQLDPTVAIPYRYLGKLYLKHKVPDPAIQVLEKAVELNPKDYKAYALLVEAYYMKGQETYPKALAAVESTLSLKPNHGRVMAISAAILASMRRTMPAVARANQAVDAGYKDKEFFAKEDFDPVRRHPLFKKMMAKLNGGEAQVTQPVSRPTPKKPKPQPIAPGLPALVPLN